MGMPNIDGRDLGRRVDDGKRSTGTDEIQNAAMYHEKVGCVKETRRKASFAAGSAGMK